MRSNHDREIVCERCGEVTLNRLKYCKPCADIVKAEQVRANNAEIRKLSGIAKDVIVKKVKIIYNELIFDCGNTPEID